MSIAGSGVSDPNLTLRFLILVFIGIVAISAVEFWKESLFTSAEYQPLPTTHKEIQIHKQNQQKQVANETQLLKQELNQ